MKISYLIIALLAVCLTARTSLAATYLKVLSKDQIQGDGGSKSCYATIIEGTTAYNVLSLLNDPKNLSDSGRITVTTGVGTANPTTTELLSTTDWMIANGGATNSMAAFYGADIVGEFLQFSDTSTDAIWRVDKTTGVVTPYVSKAQIQTQLGLAGAASLLAWRGSGPDGEHYVYEGSSGSFIRSTGPGTVETYVSNTELDTLTGNPTEISGGITFDDAGRMLFGNGGSGAIYSWDDTAAAGSEGSVLLSGADIMAVTGEETSGGFGDIYYAPNGRVYFYERVSDGILSFDPGDAASTLEFVLTYDDLTAGPAGSDSIAQFTWYAGNIAWTPISPSVPMGLYAVPLPGDANHDGSVDVSDLGILATNYDAGSGFGWGEGDFTGDGLVDVSDLGILATNYGTEAAAAVPEPATAGLLLAAACGLCLIQRTRRSKRNVI